MSLTRQQRRQAERRLKKDRFPFPKKHQLVYLFLQQNPEMFAQSDPTTGEITTNMTGETKVMGIDEFYEFVNSLQVNPEKQEIVYVDPNTHKKPVIVKLICGKTFNAEGEVHQGELLSIIPEEKFTRLNRYR